MSSFPLFKFYFVLEIDSYMYYVFSFDLNFDLNIGPILLIASVTKYLCLCELTDSLCQNICIGYLFRLGFHKT